MENIPVLQNDGKKKSRDISRRICNTSRYFKIVIYLFHYSSWTSDNVLWNSGWEALQQT
jgi:hypothetical protein